jgi:hypothetical protein
MSIPALFCPDLFSSAFLLEISSLRACPLSLAEAGHVTNFQQFLRLENLNRRQQLYFLKSEVQPGIDPKFFVLTPGEPQWNPSSTTSYALITRCQSEISRTHVTTVKNKITLLAFKSRTRDLTTMGYHGSSQHLNIPLASS